MGDIHMDKNNNENLWKKLEYIDMASQIRAGLERKRNNFKEISTETIKAKATREIRNEITVAEQVKDFLDICEPVEYKDFLINALTVVKEDLKSQVEIAYKKIDAGVAMETRAQRYIVTESDEQIIKTVESQIAKIGEKNVILRNQLDSNSRFDMYGFQYVASSMMSVIKMLNARYEDITNDIIAEELEEAFDFAADEKLVWNNNLSC